MSSPANRLYRRSSLSLHRPSERWATKCSSVDLTSYHIKEYLARYPSVFEDYLLKTTSLEFLERVLEKKQSSTIHRTVSLHKRPTSVKLHSLYSEIGIQEVARQIMECTTDTEIYGKIYDVCTVIAYTVDAFLFNLYILNESETELSLFTPGTEGSLRRVGPVGRRLTVSAHIAVEKKSINAVDLPQDSRFPKGIALGDYEAHQVMGIPILLETGRCYAVVELVRRWDGEPFSGPVFELTNAILSWVTACVQKMKRNKLLKIQSTLDSYLLETTKVMFDDMDNIDLLITNIMTFAKVLVSADRCGLFLVDEEKKELYADYFDEGKTNEKGEPVYTKGSQIRFSQSRGISGYVAETGEIVNIKDAYKDNRFNPEVDKKTGYRTKNILCMPIQGKHGVIGVVNLLNKQNGEYFTDEDESAFQLFSLYCALALHYSRLYNLMALQRAKYKVAMEVCEFHLCCPSEESDALYEDLLLADDKIPDDFYNFDFCCYEYNNILPQLFIRIIQDMFGNNLFDMQTLCRFTLTVRKNYRPITYHNWQHGFHVAHALWMMIRSTQSKFSRLEKMSFVIGGLCHDLDHRGYNNDFFKKMKLPLAALYSSSTMEQHHYRQTVTILHTEGMDIFSFLSSKEHAVILEMIRKNIIATDLALYFGNQKFMTRLLENNEFDASVPTHRDTMLALMMTGADLCAIPKPWDTQEKTVDDLYHEFFQQGDEEKQAGMQPAPMMDRLKKDDIPKQQIGFIDFICKPLYWTLTKLMPELQPYVDGCNVCRDHWVELVAQKEAENSNDGNNSQIQ